jgi:hypothetical protein
MPRNIGPKCGEKELRPPPPKNWIDFHGPYTTVGLIKKHPVFRLNLSSEEKVHTVRGWSFSQKEGN